MKIEDFKKQLKELQVSSREISNYIRELKKNGHCYINIKDRQYLCIANN